MTRKMMNQMRKLFKEQIPLTQIAKILNVSQATISRKSKLLGLYRDNLNKKISDNEIIKFKNLTLMEIAREFKLSNQAIHERMVRLGINHKLDEYVERSAEKIRKYQLDLSHFNPLDKIGCYWLGFMYADGCLRCKQGRRPSTFSISLQKRDKEQLIKFVTDLRLPASQVKEQKRSFRIVINNIPFGRLLCSLGMDPRHLYKKNIPNILHLDHFVRGYLDGDGTIALINLKKQHRKYFVIRFAIKDYSFGIQIRNMIRQQSSIKLNGPYKMKSIWLLSASCKKARILARWIWGDPIRFLDRKYDRYLNMVSNAT